MTPDSILPVALVAQGIVGGLDTLLNHELIERLPYRLSARREIGLHAVRESIYGALFIGLAGFEWHGAAAFAIAALLAVEIVDTAADEWEENRTRVLPQNERVLHVLLTLNLGVIVALLAPTLVAWGMQSTALVARETGPVAWTLVALGLASFAWSARDATAWRRLQAEHSATRSG
jgi:hypothetical protein